MFFNRESAIVRRGVEFLKRMCLLVLARSCHADRAISSQTQRHVAKTKYLACVFAVFWHGMEFPVQSGVIGRQQRNQGPTVTEFALQLLFYWRGT